MPGWLIIGSRRILETLLRGTLTNGVFEVAEESLDRLVESLALINVNLEGLRVSLQAVIETKADHEQRIRSIERWRYHLSPVVAFLTFLLGAVCSSAIERHLQ